MSNKINTLVQDIATQLQPTYPETALQHAWWLLTAVTMQPKEKLLAQQSIELSPQQNQKLAQCLYQLISEHMPFAYVVGTIPFGDLEILIEPPILIPRPETEEWCLDLAQQLQKIPGPLTILDMCTGSGCIALTLAHALPTAHVYGVDINPAALALAHKNTQHNKIPNVTWILSDLFKNLPKTIQFDLIISNPPYISELEWQNLDKSVKNWEDQRALSAPQEGLAILSSVIHQAPAWIKNNTELQKQNIPQLTVEMGYQQGPSVVKLFEHAGFTNIQVKKDLAHHDRTVSGRVDHVAIFKKNG